MEQTELGKVLTKFYRENRKSEWRNNKHANEIFNKFMEDEGYEQTELEKGITRIILRDSFFAYLGDDRESYYGMRPLGCIASNKNVDEINNNRKMSYFLRSLFGKGNVKRCQGSSGGWGVPPSWSIKIADFDPIYGGYVGGLHIDVDIRNDGEDDITNKCFIFV